ncbi:putative antitermination protein [Bacillus phage vB_BcM_Sam112]|uniref:Putative antitermination protein n=1 Tax=Bacillus phage vB_BcM_Sam112 TaxID=2663324 RepID=A0A5Q2FBE9_9CAUD|nr:putative antitermination protein [Bacillus phage vB_BcM_Sam112]
MWTVPTHKRRGANRKPFCPNCGDFEFVNDYVSDRYNKAEKPNTWGVRWTPDEIVLLDECIKGKYTPTQLAQMLGRPVGSIYRKKHYRIKELEKIDQSG